MQKHASETRLRVRYAETDKMGVVYYANYLVWMEIGRTDFCRSVGFTYRSMESEEANMAVVEATCRYLAPARYDDEILVTTTLEHVNRRVVTFASNPPPGSQNRKVVSPPSHTVSR